MSQCPHCHGLIPEGAPSCPNCGQPAGASPLTAPPPPPYALALGEYLKAGWVLFKQYPGGFVGFFLIYLVIQILLNYAGRIGWLASLVIGPPMMMGNFIVSAKLLQEQAVNFSDFFSGFRFFLPLLLLTLVSSILVSLGFILLIIPGVYLAVSYLFASLLVIDRRLDFWPAMELSRRTVTPRWFTIFAFCLLLLLVNVAGALVLGLGLLVSVPLSICALTAAYADIFGLQSDYSEKMPRLK